MTVMRDKESMEKKHSVLQVLTLFFPKYDKVLFTPQSLLFQNKEGNVVIDENNFDFLQAAIREVTCSKSGPMDQQAFNPANDKAREIYESQSFCYQHWWHYTEIFVTMSYSEV